MLGDGHLAERSRRAITVRGLDVIVHADRRAASTTFARDEPLFVLRAGVFPRGDLIAPPRSATGRPVIAIAGSASDGQAGGLSPEALAARWHERDQLPACVYLESPRGLGDARGFGAWARSRSSRFVALAGAEVGFDERLRVALVVTTLHRGGAERVVLSLHERLLGAGITPLLAVLDRPRRASYPAPPGWLDLAAIAEKRADRLVALGQLLRTAGVDLAHLHLLSGDESRALAGTGVPIVVTLHNAAEGWQRGQGELRAGDVDLVLPCSRSADRDAAKLGLSVPRRVAWNGIDEGRLPRVAREDDALAAGRREALGLPRDHRGPVLLALANPRPQKRLELLPAILAALVVRGIDARLLIAGETVGTDAASRASIEAFEAALAQTEVAGRIARPGPQDDLAALFAVSHLLVSTSAHEGLSIAQLEAVAVGLPLVVTDVGGAEEIARLHPERVSRLAPDASAEVFADAIVACLARPARAEGARSALGLSPAFTDHAMTKRHARLYRRTLTARAPRSCDLLVVSNNLVMGGAQTSARKLLTALAADGLAVSAAVIEERPELPSVGRSALLAAGIDVFATASARTTEPDRVFDELLAHLDRCAPRNVFFWNLRPSFRARLADALVGVRVVDVSPGAMSFDALERHFAPRDAARAGEPAELLSTQDYGRLLFSAVVKYTDEVARARALLQAPVVVIPNGVALPAEARFPERDAARPLGGLVLGTACRLSPDKCLEQLVDAFRSIVTRFPTARLRVAGGDDAGHEAYGASLRASVADLPVDFVGEQRGLAAFHASVDVFVVIAEPAGCPNASLEAMAAGLPLVITDVGGARDQVEHERTGLLSPAGDTAALAAAIARLLDDADLRARLGKAARAEIEARFTIARMASSYRALLDLAPGSTSGPQ